MEFRVPDKAPLYGDRYTWFIAFLLALMYDIPESFVDDISSRYEFNVVYNSSAYTHE